MTGENWETATTPVELTVTELLLLRGLLTGPGPWPDNRDDRLDVKLSAAQQCLRPQHDAMMYTRR